MRRSPKAMQQQAFAFFTQPIGSRPSPAPPPAPTVPPAPPAQSSVVAVPQEAPAPFMLVSPPPRAKAQRWRRLVYVPDAVALPDDLINFDPFTAECVSMRENTDKAERAFLAELVDRLKANNRRRRLFKKLKARGQKGIAGVSSVLSPSALMTPGIINAVVLAVDAATNNGWAIFVAGRYYESGQVHIREDVHEVQRVCELTYRLSGVFGLPYVLVLEKPFGSKWGANNAAPTGAEQSRGVWRHEWTKLDVRSHGYVADVYPSTWMNVALPGPQNTELRRPREYILAKAISQKADIAAGSDECTAVCLGAGWAIRAIPVLEKIPARYRALLRPTA